MKSKAEKIYKAIGEGYGFNGSKEECIKLISSILSAGMPLNEITTEATVVKLLPLEFIQWYSGMEQQKILRAYERWKFEVVKPDSPVAVIWWDSLTTFKRELYIGRHYLDDTPTPEKIDALYRMYGIGVNDCC